MVYVSYYLFIFILFVGFILFLFIFSCSRITGIICVRVCMCFFIYLLLIFCFISYEIIAYITFFFSFFNFFLFNRFIYTGTHYFYQCIPVY